MANPNDKSDGVKPELTWETFNPENKKLILSIDGGGMRGVIPLAMLVYMEEKLGKPAYEIFDMVVGTSTGSIIAAGLTLGVTARELLDGVYRDKLPKALGPRGGRFWLRYIFQYYAQYMHPWDKIVNGLNELAEDITRKRRELNPNAEAISIYKTIDELAPEDENGKKIRPVLMMATKDLRTTNTYFIVTKGKGKPKFANWPLVGAVAASSAASIFFRPIDGNLVDGGVGLFGNPCLAAAIEAFEYIKPPRKSPGDPVPEHETKAQTEARIEAEAKADKERRAKGFVASESILISLGTGHTSIDLKPQAGYRRNVATWLYYIAMGGIVESALWQTVTTRALYKKRGLDFRRYNVHLNREALKELNIFIPEYINPEVDLGLDTTEHDRIELMHDIGRAYAESIDWTKSNQLSWDTPAGQPKPGLAKAKIDDPDFDKKARQAYVAAIDWQDEHDRQYKGNPSYPYFRESVAELLGLSESQPVWKKTWFPFIFLSLLLMPGIVLIGVVVILLAEAGKRGRFN